MACPVPHTYDEIKSMVEKQIQEDRGRQLVIMNLGHQFDNAITAKKEKYQGTYAESIYFLGNIQEWEFPHHIQKAIPPKMDNPQPGRPKNTNRIKSQGGEPRSIHCSRCRQAGHRRDQCNKPIVAEPPVNTRTRNDQEFPRNKQPSFYNPHQQYDNTFQGYNQYASQPYSQTTNPSQPYDQHYTNTSQPYDGNHTQSDQMYE
ncbi:hypothetical protein Tco_0751261 [Tanacetum coccineum]|uniref:CCHC-type domain-containing protein n=1 Tax=Tanacetum coccineum TaxID=301880 RepID=A0ABQ4Z3Q4_9ASTR